MNLADAIRKAAMSTEGTQTTPPTPSVAPAQPAAEFSKTPETQEPEVVKSHVEELKSSVPPAFAHQAEFAEEEHEEVQAFDALSNEPVEAPQTPNISVRGGNVVRLELFLSPEQMSTMLRSIVAGQHTMLTLREAASYLRVNPHSLENMAQNAEIPAVHLDGRWRFSKAVIDEWLAIQSFRQEGAQDVA